MTLQRRLALASAAAVLVSSLAATALVYVTVKANQLNQVDRQLIIRLQNANPRSLRQELDRSAQATSFAERGSYFYLFDAVTQGNHVPDSGVTAIVPIALPHKVDKIDVRTLDLDSKIVNQVRVAQVVFPNGSLVRVMRSVDDVYRTVRDIGTAVALIGAGFAILAAVAIGLLVGNGLRPVRKLTHAAAQAGQTGDFSPLIHESTAESIRQDEVNELTQALSFMAASVIESRNRQRRLVDDAAHELRTPLTSLRTNLQLLRQSVVQQRPLSDVDVAAALDDSLAESAELGDLTEELVALAATGGEHGSSWQQERVDALQLVREVAFRAERRSGRTIDVVANADACDVDAVRPRLERALANIIGNATKFAPEGAVRVSVSADAETVQIAVEDSGPGIAPEDRAQVTERFWRSPTTRGLPGSGLGLAIVSDVAIECGGQLDIAQSRDLGGARIVLSLPRASADSTEIS